MSKHAYALEAGGPKRLAISRSPFSSEVRVSLDGAEVGSCQADALATGETFLLPDGSKLFVLRKGSGFAPEYSLLRDGLPLPGTGPRDPARVRSAAGVMFFVAGVNVLFGIVGLLHAPFGEAIGAGWLSIAYGALFAALGVWSLRGSVVAIGVAVAVFAIDYVGWILLLSFVAKTTPPGFALIAKGAMLLAMVRALTTRKNVVVADAAAYRGATYDPNSPVPYGRPLAPGETRPAAGADAPVNALGVPIKRRRCVGCGLINPVDASECRRCGKGFAPTPPPASSSADAAAKIAAIDLSIYASKPVRKRRSLW